jgi:hypothetical protein
MLSEHKNDVLNLPTYSGMEDAFLFTLEKQQQQNISSKYSSNQSGTAVSN